MQDYDHRQFVRAPVCNPRKLLDRLAECDQLIELNLSKNRFLTDNESLFQFFGYRWEHVLSGLHAFTSNNRALRILNLAHCKITDDGVSHLLEGIRSNANS